MSDSAAEFQKLVHDTLGQNAAVIALVDGIYDKVPANPFGPKQSYLRFGYHEVITDDAECIIGGTHMLQIDCFTRKAGTVSCKRIVDAVYNALHEQEVELTENALVEMRVTLRRTFPDPDELTMHGVVFVEGMIEEYP